MKVTVVVVGKVKAPFAEADAHYRKMLQRHQPVDVIEVRDEVLPLTPTPGYFPPFWLSLDRAFTYA